MRPVILSPNDIERFWKKIDKNGPVPTHCPELGPCWEWIAGRDLDSYGQFWLSAPVRYEVPAHRFAIALATGVDPGHLLGLHHCDNPPCCNPDHLFLGTHSDSNRRGRRIDERYASFLKFLQEHPE